MVYQRYRQTDKQTDGRADGQLSKTTFCSKTTARDV